jgi:hypothetical protein
MVLQSVLCHWRGEQDIDLIRALSEIAGSTLESSWDAVEAQSGVNARACQRLVRCLLRPSDLLHDKTSCRIEFSGSNDAANDSDNAERY